MLSPQPFALPMLGSSVFCVEGCRAGLTAVFQGSLEARGGAEGAMSGARRAVRGRAD
jgi:hypothetical protein